MDLADPADELIIPGRKKGKEKYSPLTRLGGFEYEAALRYWPRPEREDKEYGPSETQKMPWWELMPPDVAKKHGHKHWTDILLMYGGGGGGKSASASARVFWVLRNFPGALGYVGSINYTHLSETTIENCWKPLLSVDGGEWNSPVVIRKPTQNKKRIIIASRYCTQMHKDCPDRKHPRLTSKLTFANLEHFDRQTGSKADIWHIEEAELLKGSYALELLLSRMRGTAWKYKQIILTANPFNFDWLVEWFNLEQLSSDYEGPKNQPFGKPCECQFCADCDEQDRGQFLYKKGTCPKCGYVKATDCPGGQVFKRVIHSTSKDNEHLREGYARDMKVTLGVDAKQQMVSGDIVMRRRGAIYDEYMTGEMVYHEAKKIDFNKTLIWALDFNRTPMSSVVMQTWRKDALIHVDILDEFMIRNAGIRQVARAFIERYGTYLSQPVHVYCDPSGFNTKNEEGVPQPEELIMLLQKAKILAELKTHHTRYPIAARIDATRNLMKSMDPVTGNSVVRLHINKDNAQWTYKSFKETIWDATGTKESDLKDKHFRDKWKPIDGVVGLSHFSCAAGYYFVKEFPTIDSNQVPWLQNTATGQVIELGKEDMIIRNVDDDDYLDEEDDEIRREMQEEAELRIARELERELAFVYSEPSIADTLRGSGNWKLGR